MCTLQWLVIGLDILGLICIKPNSIRVMLGGLLDWFGETLAMYVGSKGRLIISLFW